jgi:hypothetical protein
MVLRTVTTRKQLIRNRLQSLTELRGVSVTFPRSGGTLRVTHTKHHAPEFVFRWYTDHFVGYFIDGEGKQSQAVVSLYTPMDAIRFVSAYAILNDLRAHKKAV